jgi:hypothetical protein
MPPPRPGLPDLFANNSQIGLVPRLAPSHAEFQGLVGVSDMGSLRLNGSKLRWDSPHIPVSEPSHELPCNSIRLGREFPSTGP